MARPQSPVDDGAISAAGRIGLLGARHPRVAALLARLHARLYRLTGGRIGRSWFGAPLLVLHTVGRRTGAARATPVLYLDDGAGLVVLAANGGQDRPPAWWLNLDAAGGAEVELGGSRFPVTPEVLEGAERARLWSAFSEMYPTIDEYLTFTDREFPLVRLSPVG